jgi:hypothetical protein
MKRHWILRILKFVLFAALFVGVFSFIVMSLWNWLMPALFGWRLIKLLAGNGHFDPQQDPPRWFSRARRSSLVLAAPDAGALGADGTRGTREVPRSHSRTLRLVSATPSRSRKLEFPCRLDSM